MRHRGWTPNFLCALGTSSLLAALAFCLFFLGQEDLGQLLEAERRRSDSLQRELAREKAAGSASAKAKNAAGASELEATQALVNELKVQLSQAKEELAKKTAPAAVSRTPHESHRSLASAALPDSPPPPGTYSAVGIASVADPAHQKRFAVAIASQRCYAQKHGYDYNVLDPADYPACSFRDFFFRKHCAVAAFWRSKSPITFCL
eukprot:TRINITY_DN56465_c0_g1_i1.p1 TRINITY_DN56465_c0_g1~~TRINITY_DN56465_c0_g1_i1.p1  ORF type:complete len:205 (+),score=31.20 TRINITY_DN56465_c0_g1_i1:40-654(+)